MRDIINKEREKVRRQSEADNELRVTDRRRISITDDNAEPVNAEVEQPSLKPSYVEELEGRTKAAERKVQEVQARFDQLRGQLQKETDETRQRLNRAADERSANEKARFISALLPVLDDLTRAVDAASDAPQEGIVSGVRTILTSFKNALTSAGVEPIVSVGEQFNPELHEAVDTVEVGPEQDGQVVGEYTKGFKIGERLLRPARVRVGRAAGSAKTAFDR